MNCQRCGLHVPDDVQVVGFDNVPEAEYSVPALTTIDPHIDDYAKHAVDMLIDRIEGYSGPGPYVHHRFHIGGTCLNSTCPLASNKFASAS